MLTYGRFPESLTGAAAPVDHGDHRWYFTAVEQPGATGHITLNQWMRDGFPLAVVSVAQENTAHTHTHDFVELVCVRQGSGTHIHGAKRYPVFQGDCFVVAPGEPHGYRDESGLRISNVIFYPELIAPFGSELLQAPGFIPFFAIEPLFRAESGFRHKLHLPLTLQKTAGSLCDRIEQELDGRKPAYKPLCVALLVEMLVAICRGFDTDIERRGARAGFDGRQQTVGAAIAYLERNFARDVRVDEIAASAFISPGRLSHVFREVTGMSLMDYLNRIRIERAQQLLRETSATVAEIAYESGVDDPSYFSRLFRKVTGVTPGGYRGRS